MDKGCRLKNLKKSKELFKAKNRILKAPTAFDLKISLANK